MKGSLVSMPIVMINMGGEMVYILEQRLRAQNVVSSKGQKVLCDVVRTMYYPRLIEELFKPQDMYSARSARQIFDRIAHSSIMRLNESSMDKLFDLMAMGFKHQLLSTRRAEEVLGVTLTHLDALRKVVASQAPVVALVDDAIARVHATFDGMSEANFAVLRQTLINFLQDRRVKVSIFLQENIQAQDGSILIEAHGRLAYGVRHPGQVHYFANGEEYRTEVLPVANMHAWTPATTSSRMQVDVGVGINMYDRQPSEGPKPTSEPPPSQGDMAPAVAPEPERRPVDPEQSRQAAVGELSLLSALIGAPKAEETDTFQLKLFQTSNVDGGGGGGDANGPVIMIDAPLAGGHQTDLDNAWRDMEYAAQPQDGQDDLLDLMDAAQ